MANNMTLEEAVKLAEGSTKDLTTEQLAQMESVFSESFYNQEQRSQKTQNAADVTLSEAESRIEALSGLDSLDPAELDSIISLANTISPFSSKGDLAKSVAEKAQKQKDKLEAAQQTAESNAAGTETAQPTEGDKAAETETVDAAADKPQEQSESKPAVFEFGDQSQEQPAAENKAEPESSSDNDVKTENKSENKAEGEEVENPKLNKELDEVDNTPESEEDLAKYDAENGIGEITPEQLENNAKEVDKAEAKIGNPFALDKDGNLINKEFQEEYDAFKNLNITDEEGNPLSEEEQAKYKEDLIEAAKLEAANETWGHAKGDNVGEQYVSNLKDSLRKSVVTTAFSDKVKDGKLTTKEQFSNAFTSIMDPNNKEPKKAKVSDVTAFVGNVGASVDKFTSRVKNKVGEIPPVKWMENKAKSFDEKMQARFGKKYDISKRLGKTLLRSGINVAKYTVIGATAGNIGIAALAVKSGMDTFKGINKKAKAEGMTMWQYTKSHKWEVGLSFASTTASALSAAVGLGVTGDTLGQYVAPHLKTITRTLAIAPKAGKALWHATKLGAMKMGWMKADDEKIKATKAALAESTIQTAEATVGILAGSWLGAKLNDTGVGQWLNNLVHHDAPDATQPQTDTVHHDKAMGPETEKQFADNQASQDRDGDGIRDILDIDRGEGWATANETQIDRAFDANPAAINEILNDGQWHSSAELHHMMENGEFSEDQLKAIHAAASRDFDEKGHIIDPELKAYYEDLAKQQAAQEAPKEQTPEEYADTVRATALEQGGIEAMTHDGLVADGLVPGEKLADLEGLIAEAKQNGDFSKVDGFMAANGIDANSDAGKGVQDYINAAKGLSATGGEIPDDKFFNYKETPEQQPEAPVQDVPNNKLPGAEQMHDLADKMAARANETNSSSAFGQILREEVQAGNLTPEQAGKISQVLSETVEAHHGDYNSALRDFQHQTAQDVKLEQQQAAANEGKPVNLSETVNFGSQHGSDNNGLTEETGHVETHVRGVDPNPTVYKEGETISPEDKAYADSLRESWTEQKAEVRESPLQNKPQEAPVYHKEEAVRHAEPEQPAQETAKPEEKVVEEHKPAEQEQPKEHKPTEQEQPKESEAAKAKEDEVRKAATVTAARQGLSGEEKEAFIQKEMEKYREEHNAYAGENTEPPARTVETKLGKVSYELDDKGNLKVGHELNSWAGSSADRTIHKELANDIGDHVYGDVKDHHSALTHGGRTERQVEAIGNDARAYHAEALKVVHDDIQARLNSGENVPGAEQGLKSIDKQLSGLGLKFGKDGELTAVNNQSDLPSYKKLMDSKGYGK